MNEQASQPGDNEQHRGDGEPGDMLGSETPQARGPGASPRDYLANERTLLAWLRTGVALIGLGFVVARFGLFLRELGLRQGSLEQGVIGEHWSTLVGTAIILLAALMLGISYVRYRDAAQALAQGTYHHRRGLSLVAIFSIMLIAVVLAVYLLLTS